MGRVTQVAIIDDHESVRLGIEAVCAQAGFDVRHSVPTVADFLAASGGEPVDIVVLDLSLGDGTNPGDNVRAVRETGSAVLIHSIADRVVSVREALAAGAAGVVTKSAPTESVIQAIRTVAAGETLANLELASAIDADGDFAHVQLGPRERDVLHLYASGLPMKEVARQLGIAASTAREYLARVRVKYVEVGRPAPTKVDLLRRAVEDGVLPELSSNGTEPLG